MSECKECLSFARSLEEAVEDFAIAMGDGAPVKHGDVFQVDRPADDGRDPKGNRISRLTGSGFRLQSWMGYRLYRED